MLENRTVYDKAAIQAMTEVFTRKVRRRQYLVQRCFLLGLGTLGILCGVLLLALESLGFWARLAGVIALVVCGPALIEGLFLRRITAWRSLSALRQTGGVQEHHFTFSEDSFAGTKSGTESTWKYEAIRDAYETEGYFVLRFDKMTCVLLDKAGFTGGTAGDFRSFLTRKLEKPVIWAGRHRKTDAD